MRKLLIAVLVCVQLLLGGCAAVMTAAATHATAVAAAVDIAPLVLLTGAIGAVGIAGVARNDVPSYDAGTFGAALHARYTEVELLVRGALTNGQEGLVAAGLQVQRAIARARIAYRDSLDTKIAALGAPEQAFERDLAGMLAMLSSGGSPAIKATGDRAQMVADRLPFPAGAPQVRSFGPLYLFSFLPFQTIAVRGTFPAEYEKGQVPWLSIDGKSYVAYSYSTQSIEFSVATSALASADRQGEISWYKGEVVVPWNRPLSDPLARSGYSNFVMIGVLPDSLGRATLDVSTNVVRTEEKLRASEDFRLDDSGQARCLRLSSQELADGWKIIPATGRVETAGPADAQFQSEDERSICATARAVEPADGGDWRVTARIGRNVTESRMTSESFDLKWGDNRTFAPPPGKWRLRYSLFNRGLAEVDGPDASGQFLRVASDARGIAIRTYPF